MTTWNCADPVKSFNKRSAELKDSLLQDNCVITSEWEDHGYHCFNARKSQEDLKAGNGVYSQVTAYYCNLESVGGKSYGRVETYTVLGRGKCFVTSYHQK